MTRSFERELEKVSIPRNYAKQNNAPLQQNLQICSSQMDETTNFNNRVKEMQEMI